MRSSRLAACCALAAWLAVTLLSPSAAEAAAVNKDGAVQAAAQVPSVQAQFSRGSRIRAVADRAGSTWIVTFDVGGRVRAQVEVDALTGDVVHVFTGEKAEFPLARGPRSGVAARKLNSLWAWLPLTAIFLLAFFDWRRPFRLLHLDLAAIAVLGVSFAFFMAGKLRASVPLVYPSLLYVAVRSLFAGARPKERAGPLTRLPIRIVVSLTLILLAARILFTLADPFVIDVGYASTAGADRILHGLEIYTRGGAHFDTYGPVAYLAYVPFVLIWPFHESQTNPPAAQAAAIFFELVTVAGLVALGRRLRPASGFGWQLALAWTACPFTALALVCSSNDGLVAALLVWSLVAIASGPVSGLLAGAAAAAKFAPALLAPLLARGAGRFDLRRALLFAAAFGIVVVATLVPLLPDGGLSEFYDTTIGFQLHRFSPFSIWDQHSGLDWLQSILKAGAVLLAVVVGLVPRGRRTLAQVAGLATAVLVAEQIPLDHWFYLYVPWFLPLYCVAVFSEQGRAAADGQPAAWRRPPRPGA